MRSIFYTRHTYADYVVAINHVTRALRRRDVAAVKEWLAISEKLLRVHAQLDRLCTDDDKHKAWEEEQPHQLRAARNRANFPR